LVLVWAICGRNGKPLLFAELKNQK